MIKLSCQPRTEQPTTQYVGSRTLRSLIQFVTSQVKTIQTKIYIQLNKLKASEELKFWNWRGERVKEEDLEEDEEGEVVENESDIKDEL